MSTAAQPHPVETNQRRLMVALAEVRHAVEASIEPKPPTAPANPSPIPPGNGGTASSPLAESPAPEALEAVCATFQLSRFERAIVLLCAGPELDAQFGPLLARAQGDPRRTLPTFSLALASLPDPHWSALLPTAPLRRWRLVELSSGESLTNSGLRLDEWLLHVLTGTPQLDERLHALVRPVPVPADASPSHQALAESLARRCPEIPRGQLPPVIQICGESFDDALSVAGLTGNLLRCRSWRITATDIPAAPTERETLARLWEREAALSGAILVLDLRDGESSDGSRSVTAFLETLESLVFVLCREPLRNFFRTTWKIEITRSPVREQRSLWKQALGPLAAQLNGELERVASQFSLSAREIRETGALLQSTVHPESTDPQALPASLWEECRARSRARLESLAQRIEVASTWDDLVLPDAQLQTLREIGAHVRQRFRVYEQWGFAGKGSRGLGISALFAGPSGTGKTMAAEVLANDLNLDLFRIDLSAVVSKYIGETEKNLRRVFDAAEAGGAILLFDEADALFGKRSEVKDSHDRYANIEVGYLLQRMETYRGLAILTTNFKQSLDTAFLRRLRFVIAFPFPDASQRAEIWRRIFPTATPTDGLQPASLARLNVAGGNIRNIAIHAAFLAAESDEPVRMRHLLRAARNECAKLERPPSEAELGGWI